MNAPTEKNLNLIEVTRKQEYLFQLVYGLLISNTVILL